MNLIALDPGTEHTGYVYYASGEIIEAGTESNMDMLRRLRAVQCMPWTLCIEWVESFGMPVGREVFETVRWIGRFQQAWRMPDQVMFISRREVKLALCGSARAKDANVRQALLDLIGPRGTKAKPGPTYMVTSHAWSALAVAVTAAARLEGERRAA